MQTLTVATIVEAQTLTVATVVEVVLLVVVLAAYLIVIERVLRRIASNVEAVAAAVPALERGTEPAQSGVSHVNYRLEKVVDVLDDIAGRSRRD